MLLRFVASTLFLVAFARAEYFLGKTGANCVQVCFDHGMNFNEHIVTNNSTDIFAAVGVNCTGIADQTPWWASDQPSYDPSKPQCLGFIDVPQAVAAQGSYPTTQRICRCDKPVKARKPFGTGYSQGQITSSELTVFANVLPSDVTHGVMTHFWMTPAENSTVVRYYIDGEATASIQFKPYLACGTGFNGDHAPWGLKWFGKGAKTGGWFWNFRVPFHKSIRITATAETPSVLYIILRGAQEIPIHIGSIKLPTEAKLMQHRIDSVYQPMDFIHIADIPSGYKGLFFMHTLSFKAPNLNTLEGCYHLYSPRNQSWPGVVLSTGTEDFFDSAYYFNAGRFWLPVSGMTRLEKTPRDNVTLSAYRFHEEDPILFDDGLIIDWRNGDMYDRSGIKCLIENGGTIVGSPGAAHVEAYSWTYVWKN